MSPKCHRQKFFFLVWIPSSLFNPSTLVDRFVGERRWCLGWSRLCGYLAWSDAPLATNGSSHLPTVDLLAAAAPIEMDLARLDRFVSTHLHSALVHRLQLSAQKKREKHTHKNGISIIIFFKSRKRFIIENVRKKEMSQNQTVKSYCSV